MSYGASIKHSATWHGFQCNDDLSQTLFIFQRDCGFPVSELDGSGRPNSQDRRVICVQATLSQCLRVSVAGPAYKYSFNKFSSISTRPEVLGAGSPFSIIYRFSRVKFSCPASISLPMPESQLA